MTATPTLDRVHRRAAERLLEELQRRRSIRASFPSQRSRGRVLRRRILSAPPRR